MGAYSRLNIFKEGVFVEFDEAEIDSDEARLNREVRSSEVEDKDDSAISEDVVRAETADEDNEKYLLKYSLDQRNFKVFKDTGNLMEAYGSMHEENEEGVLAFKSSERREQEVDAIINHILDHILVGWENVRGPDGNIMEYSRENAKKMLQDIPDMIAWILTKSVDAKLFRNREMEKAKKK